MTNAECRAWRMVAHNYDRQRYADELPDALLSVLGCAPICDERDLEDIELVRELSARFKANLRERGLLRGRRSKDELDTFRRTRPASVRAA